MMKKVTILLILLFSSGMMMAQKTKSNKKLKSGIQSKTNLKQVKKDCNYVYDEYKNLLRHILNKSEQESLSLEKVSPSARVEYKPNLSPELHFIQGNVMKKLKPLPTLNNHFVQQPNGVYTVAVEMVSYLYSNNGWNSILGFSYQEGNYENVVEVLDVVRANNKYFLSIRRSNGVTEKIRYFPNHTIAGCDIEGL